MFLLYTKKKNRADCNFLHIASSSFFQTTSIAMLPCFLRFFFFFNAVERSQITWQMIPSNKKICPMCKGTGYFEETTNREKSTMSTPEILQLCGGKNIAKRLNAAGGDSSFKSSKNRNENHESFPIATDSVSTLDHDFLGETEKFINIQDTARLAVQKLKLNNWEISVSALLNIVHISRIQPEIIDSSMPLITRSLHSLMRNVRTHVVRTACQIAEELFKTVQCTQQPEFDELVLCLLQKTCHMSKIVRKDANKALDTMALYIPASHCLCVMSSNNNAGHKNPIVRTTVSRLLYNIVNGVGVETFLTTSNLRDARRKTFVMCIEFLNDPSTETRSNARRLMQLLMRHSDFDKVFSQDVERSLIKKIEKQLIALKYENRVE